MTQHPGLHDRGEVPLAEVLDRTATELGRCRDIVLRIEATTHALLDGSAPLSDIRADLQAIDLLDQRLGDLTTWVGALAAATGGALLPGPVGRLLHDLRLADLREALSGPPAGAPGSGDAFPSSFQARTELF